MTEFGFQRPKYLEPDYDSMTNRYGRFNAQPFERGYGITVGNSLRRILLSSIPGAALTAVRIHGVLHEFSTIPGVVEDVTDILLNLKSIPLKLNGSQSKTITLNVVGPAEVKASDIVHDSDVEILDKDVSIAHLDKDGKLQVEMIVKNNRGYIHADQNYDPELSVDFIPMDSSHSPVTKVNYRVEPARVGKRIDYESLALEIWTTGALSPVEGLSQAAKILRELQQMGQVLYNEIFPVSIKHRRRAGGARGGGLQEGDSLPGPGGHSVQAHRAPRAVGSVEQLPALGRHREDLRTGPQDRGRPAQDQELRAQVAFGDQGDAVQPRAGLEFGPSSQALGTAPR